MRYQLLIASLLFTTFTYAKELTIIPEYEQTNAIIISIDENFFSKTPPAEEKRNATLKLAQENPKMQFAIFGTKEVSEKAQEFFRDKSNILYINLNLDKIYPWARDWVPRVLSSGHLLNFYGGTIEEESFLSSIICNSLYKQPTALSGTEIIVELNGEVALISDAILYSQKMDDIEGGDLIVGKNRQCFTAGDKDDYSGRKIPGCSELHVLPELPGESTGHIDIFAQFINKDTVMVANYKTNQMQNAIFEVLDFHFKCDRESIENKNWVECEQTLSPRVPKAKGSKGKNGIIQVNFDWVGHTQTVKSYFEKLGYKVELVDQPLPVFYETSEYYFDANGEKVNSTKDNNYFFPSYINSVLINENVGTPIFSEYASDELNRKAINSYKKFRNKVTPLEQSSSAILNGGPHCWTSNLL